MVTTLEAKTAALQGLPSPSERRKIRERAGLSQADVATELGVDRSAVTRWEQGNRRPRGKALEAYVSLLCALRLSGELMGDLARLGTRVAFGAALSKTEMAWMETMGWEWLESDDALRTLVGGLAIRVVALERSLAAAAS